jgi:hypothetical protein
MQKSALRIPLFLGVVILAGVCFKVYAQDAELYKQRARCAEMYTTVSVIQNAEEMFVVDRGGYASRYDGVDQGNYNLCFSDNPACRNNFLTILGVDIPENSPFAYEVSGHPAKISVMVKEITNSGTLCHIFIEGPQKGQWFVNSKHPWRRFLLIDGAQYY